MPESTTARERPILFSSPMVRAIIAGTKTQTRRIVKFPRAPNHLGQWEPTTTGGPDGGRLLVGGQLVPDPDPARVAMWHTRTGSHVWCPYGFPTDRLWVRETWGWGNERCKAAQCVVYQADKSAREAFCSGGPDTLADILGKPVRRFTEPERWRPSIFMPRWASRLTLEVLAVRVQRLQEISDEDVQSEGISPEYVSGPGAPDYAMQRRLALAELWDGIDGKRTPWASNPWVWALTFRIVKGGES